jgi:tetratricopeptide (TPR) repeat protein
LFETEIFKNDPMNINVAITKTSLAMCKSSLKKHREAEELFKSALVIFKKSNMDPQEIAPIQCVTRLGNVLLAQGKHEEAEKLLVPYYEQLVKAGAHQRSLGIIYCLARLYYDEARFAEARPLLERAFDLSRGSTLEPIIRTSYLSLLWEMGDVENALDQSVEVRKAKFVAFVESCTMITRDCALDGAARKYTIDIENKVAIDHHLTGNRKLPEGTILVITFEHPDKNEKAVMIEHVVERGESLIKLESPVMSGDAESSPFTADKFYEIVVRAYSDAEHENLIGTHHQLMVERSSAQRSQRG